MCVYIQVKKQLREYNENITINPLLPLESQDIDEQAFQYEGILKRLSESLF